MLTALVVLLAAATIAVPLTRRAGFGSVLGYLLAGIVIGPAGLRLITNVDDIASIASLGVVMLLFLIGLELRPQRLWVMRRAVFGLGTAQLVITAAAIAALAHATGIAWQGAIVLGAGLAMSSTAIVLPMLAISTRVVFSKFPCVNSMYILVVDPGSERTEKRNSLKRLRSYNGVFGSV